MLSAVTVLNAEPRFQEYARNIQHHLLQLERTDVTNYNYEYTARLRSCFIIAYDGHICVNNIQI
jgi:hypothetical protein